MPDTPFGRPLADFAGVGVVDGVAALVAAGVVGTEAGVAAAAAACVDSSTTLRREWFEPP
jgi:hypothetical protein